MIATFFLGALVGWGLEFWRGRAEREQHESDKVWLDKSRVVRLSPSIKINSGG